jgi:hypothetical protein
MANHFGHIAALDRILDRIQEDVAMPKLRRVVPNIRPPGLPRIPWGGEKGWALL